MSNGVLFFGGANITLSESSGAGGASLSIVGGAGAAFSGGVSSGGNSAGTTGTVGNGIRFFGGNSITLSQSSAAGGATISVVGPSAWSQSAGMSNLGNTVGTTGIASGSAIRYLLAGGNNITLSQSINGASGTVTISGPNAQTGISGIAGSGASTVTNGTVQFANSNNVSFGLNGSTMTASFSTAAQTVESQSLGMSNLGNTSGTTGIASGGQVRFLFAGGNNITLSQSLNGASGTITISGGAGGAFTGGVSSGGNTAGTTGTVNNGIVFVGGNNITLSQSSAAGGATITISAPSGGGIGVSSGGNTAGTTGTVDFQMVFVGSNNITLSQSINGSSGTLSIIGGGGGAFAGGVSTVGNTSGDTKTIGSQLVFAGTNNITLSQSTNGGSATIIVSGPTGGGAGMGSATNTFGTSGSVGDELYFFAGANVSLSQSVSSGSASLTIIAPTPGTAAGAAIGITNTGSTSGTNFTTLGGTVYYQGSNNITVSNSSAASVQTVWISGPTGGGAGMGSTSNTFGTSGTVGKELYFFGGNQVSLSQSVNGASASLTILGEPVRSKFYWMPEGAITSSAMTHGSASFQAVMVPYDISFTRVDIPIQIALTSSATANTCAWVVSSGCVIYSVSNNSTLNPVIGSFGTTTHTFASNSAGNQSIAGGRFASFAMGTSLSAGWYIVGFQLSTANTSSVGTATTAIPVAVSVLLGSNYTALAYNDIGSATAATTDIPWGRGVANSTITATNATMNINGITQTGVSKCRGNFHVLFRGIP